MSDVMTREVAADSGNPSGSSSETAGDARQFVIFHVKDEMFAVPLAEVQEIIRMPDVVRMPLSPAALEGLANLRGTVLPVISLRSVFGFDQVSHDDATRVVVLDQGRPVGLVVDRMANVVTVEANDIEGADTIQSTVDTKLLTGMIKGRNGSSMVMILDAVNTIKREFHDLGGRSDSGRGTALNGQHTEETAAAKSNGSTIDENQLVSFEVAGQEYAFPIEEVQEIVQLPEHVTEVPNTPSHVLGVITLRNRLLPLVSLREMFGLAPAEVTDANKVVVVSLGEGTGTSVGVVMDSIKEVLRVGRSAIDAMPSLLAQNRSLNDIQSICRLDDGKRLVSILSAGRMFDVAEVRKLVGGETEGNEAMTNGEEVAAASRERRRGAVRRVSLDERGIWRADRFRPGDRPRARRTDPGAQDAGSSSKASSTFAAACCRWWISGAGSACRESNATTASASWCSPLRGYARASSSIRFPR